LDFSFQDRRTSLPLFDFLSIEGKGSSSPFLLLSVDLYGINAWRGVFRSAD